MKVTLLKGNLNSHKLVELPILADLLKDETKHISDCIWAYAECFWHPKGTYQTIIIWLKGCFL